MKKLILLWMFFLGMSNSVAQQCNIEITFTTVANKWADQLSWNLLDNSGRYVLGGYFNDTPYASAISYVYNYVAKDPPYKLLIDNTKDKYLDNSVNYSVKVGGSVVATGTVVGTKKEIKTINLTLPATCACSTPVCEVCPNGEDFIFRTQADLTNFKNSFPNCRNIKLGNVTIGQSYDGFFNPGTTSTYVTDITDISALENVSETTGNLELMYNTRLESLMSLSKVKKIGGSLRIHKNILLENLYGLHNVESINGELSLRFNAKLKNLNTLKATGLKTKLTLETNALLQYCNAPVVCNYLNTTGAYTISGNASNCISKANILNTCSTSGAVVCPDGTVNIMLTTQTAVDSFAATYVACSNITVNNLTIGNVDATLSDITSLVPLNSIIAVKGDLTIRNNPNLTSLEGLTNLKEAKSITIDNNSKLIHLDQLSNITTLNGGISISNNLILNNISGLSNIPTASIQTTGLTIANNVALTLCNLPNFCQYLLGSGTRNITGNKANCISEAAIKQACYPIVPDANNILYVNKSVATSGDGSSWTNPIKELADALRWARQQNNFTSANPLKIYVAKGTYKPMYNAANGQFTTNGNRNNAFVMVNNVLLYGGFDPANGIDDLTDKRIFGDSGTVLSGDFNNDDTSVLPNHTTRQDNAYHVVIGSYLNGESILDGLSIVGGNANGTTSTLVYNGDGGGIYFRNSTGLGLKNVVIKKNSCIQDGAGMLNSFSTLSIENASIKDNVASNITSTHGGGMKNIGSTIVMKNIELANNTSASSSGFALGGAIVNLNSSNITLINAKINNNRSAIGAIYNNNSNAKLINSTIANNTMTYTSATYLGALYQGNFEVYNSILYGNNNGDFSTTSTNITIKNSITQIYNSGNLADNNFIGVNPLFVNPSSGDYNLQSASPAIDKGDSTFYTTTGGYLSTDKDLEGNNRLSECTIDMGAYEYQNPDTYINWNGTSWSNTSGPTQSLGACINNNYNLTNNLTAKNLKVLNGTLNIQPNSSVTVYGNITQSADNDIVLENDANLIQIDDNAVNSNHKIHVKRSASMRKMDYTYWGTPVSNQKLLNDTTLNDGFSVGTPNNRIYRYNEPNDYFAATTDSHFVPGKGYAIRGKDGFDENNLSSNVYLFSGNANNGVYSTSVQKSKNTILSGVEYEHGYNLIGNPYPSNIDYDKFFNLNTNSSKIFGKVWFWTNVAPRLNQSGSGYTGNNYATLNLTGGTPPTTTQPNSGLTPTQYIKVGQGFIVQVRTPSTMTSPLVTHQLDFNNSIRTDEAGVFYNAKNSSSGKDRFWLQLVSPQQFTNTILVGYVNGATNQYDGDYDAEVMSLGDDSVYTLLGSQKLQIEGRQYPLSTEDIVPLGLKYAEDGIYQLSLSTKEGIFNNNQTIYIKDKLFNKTVNISEEAYSFQAIKGTDENRFEIVYKPGNYLDTNSSLGQQLIVYKDKNEFVAKSSQSIKKIQLFDMSGRLWDEVSGNSKELRISHQSLVNGGYVLKIHSGNDIVTKKVIK